MAKTLVHGDGDAKMAAIQQLLYENRQEYNRLNAKLQELRVDEENNDWEIHQLSELIDSLLVERSQLQHQVRQWR